MVNGSVNNVTAWYTVLDKTKVKAHQRKRSNTSSTLSKTRNYHRKARLIFQCVIFSVKIKLIVIDFIFSEVIGISVSEVSERFGLGMVAF